MKIIHRFATIYETMRKSFIPETNFFLFIELGKIIYYFAMKLEGKHLSLTLRKPRKHIAMSEDKILKFQEIK